TYTGWEAREMPSAGYTADLNVNYVNTATAGGSRCIHMENWDDDVGFRYGFARMLWNASNFLDNLTISISVQGDKYETSAAYASHAGISIIEDSNNDGKYEAWGGGVDNHIKYWLDYDGQDYFYGTIENASSGNGTAIWIPIANDWDGMTWYDVQRNITLDWYNYMGYYLNNSIISIQLENFMRRDGGGSFYMWSNWDNLTITGSPILILPDIIKPELSFVGIVSTDIKVGESLNLSILLNDENPDGFEIFKDGILVAWGNFSYNSIITFQVDSSVAGVYNYTIRAWDDYGNSEELTIFITVNSYHFDGFSITIILIAVISGGIVGGVSFSTYRRKTTTRTRIKQKKSPSYSDPDLGSVPKISSGESSRKRQRLMRRPPITENEAESQIAKLDNDNSPIEDVDIEKRIHNAEEMENEITLQKLDHICVIHKGKITGLSYICNQCGTEYCVNCASHLISKQENCWNCGNIINISRDFTSTGDIMPQKAQVTLFSEQVLERLEEMDLPEEELGEILTCLKDIPPDARLQYINNVFLDMTNDFDE
ncbi:MAG: hypothetical protein ACFFCS_21885, partial [Candidatus Hodarchaeota archaeon]